MKTGLWALTSLLFLLLGSTPVSAVDSTGAERVFNCFKLNVLTRFFKRDPGVAQTELPREPAPPAEDYHGLPSPPNGEPGEAEVWNVDGPGNAKAGYETSFSSIIAKTDPGRSSIDFFENFLRQRRNARQGTNVLDLFGSGFFVKDRNLANSITGLRYGPIKRSELPKGFPASAIPPEVLGDIFSSKTWQNLDNSMRTRAIRSLDLVTMRPVGGWQYLYLKTPEQNINALEYIIRNVQPRLSRTGRFYFEIPIQQIPGSLADNPELKRFAQEIEATTPFKLVLNATMSVMNTTYSLSGALIPK